MDPSSITPYYLAIAEDSHVSSLKKITTEKGIELLKDITQDKFVITGLPPGRVEHILGLISRIVFITEGNKNNLKSILDRSINKLFELKGSINQELKNGDRVLHVAVKCHSLPLVKALIENGANVNLTDKDGKKASSLASSLGYKECEKELKRQENLAQFNRRLSVQVESIKGVFKSVPENASNSYQGSQYFVSLSKHSENTLKSLEKVSGEYAISLLNELKSSDFKVPNREKLEDILDFLLRIDFITGEKDRNGFEKHFKKTVKELILSRKDKCSSLGNLLHFAVERNSPLLLRALLKSGINSDCKDKNGLSPLDLSFNLGYSDCNKILKNHKKIKEKKVSIELNEFLNQFSKLTIKNQNPDKKERGLKLSNTAPVSLSRLFNILVNNPMSLYDLAKAELSVIERYPKISINQALDYLIELERNEFKIQGAPQEGNPESILDLLLKIDLFTQRKDLNENNEFIFKLVDVLYKFDVDQQIFNNQTTPLHYVTYRDSPTLLAALILAGADSSVKEDSSALTPSELAWDLGNLKCYRELVIGDVDNIPSVRHKILSKIKDCLAADFCQKSEGQQMILLIYNLLTTLQDLDGQPFDTTLYLHIQNIQQVNFKKRVLTVEFNNIKNEFYNKIFPYFSGTIKTQEFSGLQSFQLSTQIKFSLQSLIEELTSDEKIPQGTQS